MSADLSSEPLPLWVRVAGIPLAGILLVVFFIYLGFPYDALAERIAVQVERATGIHLSFGDVSPHLGLLGPGLAATDVSADDGKSMQLRLDEVVIRPAWSLSWLTFDPAVHLGVTREAAVIDGTLTMGDEPAWEGEIEGFDVGLLPIERILPAGSLNGMLQANADLRAEADGLAGTLVFTLSDGSLGLPGVPVGVPFEVLTGDVVFGGELFALVNQLDLDGPMLAAKAKGNIGKAARRGDEALDLAVEIQVRDPNLKGVVRGMGIRVAGDGAAKIRVTGPLSKPRVAKGG